MSEKYIKSPMNYIGGKYKLLPQIIPHFPKDIDNFIDLFCGGLDVSLNVKANNIIANDNNFLLIDLYKEMQIYTIDDLLDYIYKQIDKYELSKENKIGYNNLRNCYNTNRYSLDLFVLICYSFNHQMRFNNNLEFNCTFGKDRSSFNDSIKDNLIMMMDKINDISFRTGDFEDFNYEKYGKKDFFYCDPPYLITCGSYNDGKRGFKGWGIEQEKKLYEILDILNKNNVKFCLSNVVEHKGNTNNILFEWMQNYDIIDINKDYSNSNYQRKDKETITREILVKNY